MRLAVLAGFALAAPAAAAADRQPYYAVADQDEVLVRAGPSPSYPETGTVPRGTRLLVDHEDQNGWLAVAHAPGSVSWVVAVQVKFDVEEVRPFPRQAVASIDTEVSAGRVGHGEPLNVRRARVPAGTVLTVIGQKVTVDGKSWYPVLPPADDFRYVPKSAVRLLGAANTSFSVSETPPPGLPPAGRAEGGVTPAAAAHRQDAGATRESGGPPPTTHPLWPKAEEAEKAGRYDEAEGLFWRIARESAAADHDTANLCYSRIHTLREKKRGGPPPASGGREPPDPFVPSGGSRPPLANTPSARPAGLGPPVRADRNDPPADRDRAVWTAGRLAASPLVIDGQTAYALEGAPGVVKAYVVAGRRVDLSRYVRQRVEVYGVPQTRRDITNKFIVATGVREGE